MRIVPYLLVFLALPAFAVDDETLEEVDLVTFSKFHKAHKDEYMKYRTSDHFEWTLYGNYYDKPNYGHRFEWTKPGLGSMSVCVEVDPKTGGGKYRHKVDDEYCQRLAVDYRWKVPFEGQLSRCVEQDERTGGLTYQRIVDDKKCSAVPTTFAWESKGPGSAAECFEVDGETAGGQYRRPTHTSHCARSLDVVIAHGRKLPEVPGQERRISRKPASVGPALEFDPRFRENPEDSVDHVHRGGDSIHGRSLQEE